MSRCLASRGNLTTVATGEEADPNPIDLRATCDAFRILPVGDTLRGRLQHSKQQGLKALSNNY